MPPGRMYKRKARRYAKKAVKKYAKAIVPKNPVSSGVMRSIKPRIPLGPKFKTSLRYHERDLNLTSAAGIINRYLFSANGVFDPNISGTGHQPLGYDQISLMYDHYTVIGAQAKVEWNVQSLTSGTMAFYIDDDVASSPTDINTVIEQGSAKWVKVKARESGSERESGVFTLQINPNKYLGVSNPIGNKDVTAATTANPAEAVHFAICVQGDGTQTVTADFSITIDYEVVFTEPKDLASS